jgi:hypothetical protein
MMLPELHGKLTAKDFFIYAACDQNYFDQFAKSLVNSIKANSTDSIHLHIFNPRQDQLDFCREKIVSVSYEYVDESLFKHSADKWSSTTLSPLQLDQRRRTYTAMSKSDDKSLQERMLKTYYACARFIRLSQLVETQSFLAIDVDAVVRKTLEPLTGSDLFLHRVPGAKARFLAGGIYGSTNSYKFLQQYCDSILDFLSADYLYWGLDQDILEVIVPNYAWSQLPYSYIDWEMKSDSHVWTAKGTRKDLAVFINEQKKYMF